MGRGTGRVVATAALGVFATGLTTHVAGPVDLGGLERFGASGNPDAGATRAALDTIAVLTVATICSLLLLSAIRASRAGRPGRPLRDGTVALALAVTLLIAAVAHHRAPTVPICCDSAPAQGTSSEAPR